jgi:hypothetical protein
MIGALITSQTRIKLLKKFFLNSSTKAHLRGLESEFGDSTNAIRIELNRFEEAGLLVSSQESNRKLYQANIDHPLFPDIHSIVIKENGFDRIIDSIIDGVGELSCVYLTGDAAHGRCCELIELIIIGINIVVEKLSGNVVRAEVLTGKEIRFVVIKPEESKAYLDRYSSGDLLALWDCEKAQSVEKNV